jgi:2-polyprenyl-6-hydroxyphenyl methylase/3-demethylubiquinone-9 3-methyltransferase
MAAAIKTTTADSAKARDAYASFADRYAALAPTKAHNGLYERPATLAMLGEVGGLDVLDAGCGPGICSEILARRGATVVGIDVTPEMVDLARRRCAGLPATFTVDDLTQPLRGIGDGSFDRVLCALALDHVEELAPVFAEFRRVTRHGGRLVFSLAHPMSDWADERIRGESIYYERARFGLHWTGFGDPYPFVEAFRRPLAEILNDLVAAGWVFDQLVEPRPLPAMARTDPRTFAELSRAPAFLCVRACRPADASSP